MDTRFKLEEHIMDCWGVIEDLDLIKESLNEPEVNTEEVVNSVRVLYEMKFVRLFNTFERLIAEGYEKAQKQYADRGGNAGIWDTRRDPELGDDL
jgi:hypothetical protein